MRIIDSLAKKKLKESGFSLRGTTWYRYTPAFIHIINFQKSMWSNFYYMNIGMDINDLSEGRDNSYIPKEYQCPVRCRAEDIHGAKQYLEVLNFETPLSDDDRQASLDSLIELVLSQLEMLYDKEDMRRLCKNPSMLSSWWVASTFSETLKNSAESLNTRMGTYDADLNRIGD